MSLLQPAPEPLLEVEGLAVEFATDRGWERVVNDVSFTVGKGEVLGIVGESGSGKSVTCLAVTGLIPRPPGRIAAGSVRFDGIELLGMSQKGMEDIRGDEISMIFQEPMTSLNPAYTVGEQISEVVRRHRGMNKQQGMQHAIEMLGRVGIPNPRARAKEYPHQFSGGMRQRVMIAIALACEPKLVIADEPTTALDVTVQAQVLNLLRDMEDEFHMSLIFITHDLGVVADICDRVHVMYAGRIVETGSVYDIYHNPTHPYTEGLLNAMPQVGARFGRLPSIPGSTPVPSSLPDGCHFNPRCPYAQERCRSGHIPLIPTGDGRLSRCVRVGELDLVGTA
jgi:oligopeptide/dipeptide ABC transporter ATP-binding protein